ncbi:MAG: hypothetical protein GC185_05735 [Alphaproteobacteria bacterium]|nr:hypothetical protein [Alphaproteobacteria bacterium]
MAIDPGFYDDITTSPAKAPEKPQQPLYETLLRNSDDAKRWEDCAQAINEYVSQLDLSDARLVSPGPDQDQKTEERRAAALEPLRKMARAIGNAQWPRNRQHYTFGKMDTDTLILCCEKRLIDWQAAFNGKAAFGTPEDLVKMQDGAKLINVTLNPSYALAWAAKPQLFTTGLWHDGNIETTKQLFEMGANPGYDNSGALYLAVVEAGRKDIGRIFAHYGQNGLLNLAGWAESAKRNGNAKVYQDLRDINFEYGNFHMIDNSTLQQTKPLQESNSTLKVIFDFAARRVHEILDVASASPRQTTVKDFSFDDYGRAALEEAREKLIEMGGHPPQIEEQIGGKPTMPRPAKTTLRPVGK